MYTVRAVNIKIYKGGNIMEETLNNKYRELADLIFPDVTKTVEDLEKLYPRRELKEGACVTRFAPSPTGFLHTGALFTSIVNKKLANQTGGVFYLRIENTDKKREVEGSVDDLTSQMKNLIFLLMKVLYQKMKKLENMVHILKVREKIYIEYVQNI